METLANASTLSRTLITNEIALSVKSEQNDFVSTMALFEFLTDIITHTDEDFESALVLA